MNLQCRLGLLVAILLVSATGSPVWGEDVSWPDLSSPAVAVGGGEHDAAVVVGVENYAFVPKVPGAEVNAKAWYDYLTKTRGASAGRIKLLLNNDAAREDMLDAAQKAAAKAGLDGTLWFVFIGHGAPSADGKDGLLVGVDAQQADINYDALKKLALEVPEEEVVASPPMKPTDLFNEADKQLQTKSYVLAAPRRVSTWNRSPRTFPGAPKPEPRSVSSSSSTHQPHKPTTFRALSRPASFRNSNSSLPVS